MASVISLTILYALTCGLSSAGLAMEWGLAAQLIALPVYVINGFWMGRKLV